jgi:hypothetical protein
MSRGCQVALADPFDLPDWVGVERVVWCSASGLGGHLVAGELHSGDQRLGCDLLAGDLAHPAPVLADSWRSAAHQAWSLGEVLLLLRDSRLTLTVPGSAVEVDVALEAVRRLARSVGAPSERFAVTLRL